jgi:serine protease Do
MNTIRTIVGALCLFLLARDVSAQNSSGRPPRLPEGRFKSGAITLRAFAPVAEVVRDCVVKFIIDGKTVALGAVVDADGLVITKATEIKDGKLKCRLANGREVDAQRLAADDENDVALVKVMVAAGDLKTIKWSAEDVSVGQWAVTPGIETFPEAVGVISVPSRKILHKRALIGVLLDFQAASARIKEVMPDMGAEKAGLKPGDVILAVNDAPIAKSEELTSTLRNYRDGHTVKLRVRREQEEFDAEVTLSLPKPERTPRGFSREERMNRLGGEVSQRAEGFDLALQHDTTLQPGQCGGPLVNLDGKAIGLNIARAGRVASYALPSSLVKQIIEDLKARAQLPVKHEPARATPQ